MQSRALATLPRTLSSAILQCHARKRQELQSTRRATRDAPYCHAVLAALDLSDYRALPRHQAGFIAARLGLSVEDEEQAISVLAASDQIRRIRGRWAPARAATVDTRPDPDAARKLVAHCAEQGLVRSRQHAEGAFAFNVFSVSARDIERLKALQRDYFAGLRRIVAGSNGTELVVIANLQLVPLSTDLRSPDKACGADDSDAAILASS